MILLGNDIVALDRRAGRSGQPEFYSKIITPAEKTLFAPERFPHLPFEHFVWLCWAIKEAAFKCLDRANPGGLFWGPRITLSQLSSLDTLPGNYRLETGDSPNTSGGHIPPGTHTSLRAYAALAHYNGNPFQAWVLATDAYILALALPGEAFRLADFEAVHWGIRRIGSSGRSQQSAGVRKFLLEEWQHYSPDQDLTIEKAPEGYPQLLVDGLPLDCGLSFSHHSTLVSYAFLPGPRGLIHNSGYPVSATERN